MGQRVEHVLADDQRVPQEKTVRSDDDGWSVADDMAFVPTQLAEIVSALEAIAMVAEDNAANLLRRRILPMLDT